MSRKRIQERRVALYSCVEIYVVMHVRVLSSHCARLSDIVYVFSRVWAIDYGPSLSTDYGHVLIWSVPGTAAARRGSIESLTSK